jgi:hypothetical protein
MAPLPFSCETVELRAALEERRLADAKKLAIRWLRAGRCSSEFLNIVADLWELEKQSGKMGAKKKLCPPHWYEIGSEYDELRAAGYKSDDACGQLKTKHRRSIRSIRTAVAYFRKCRAAHDADAANK